MKTNYEQKFKDRNPQETIQIIQKYFSDIGCSIKEVFYDQSVGDTYSCQLELYFEDYVLIAQNGKGTTPDFCRASAHGELYERFCNKMYYLCNTTLSNKVMQYSFDHYGYYLDKNEKNITYEEAFNSSALGRNYLKSYNSKSQPELLKNFFDLIFNNNYLGVPYTKASNPNECKYFDPRIIFYLCGSSGLAAGNTLEEAFVQGMSELYEHYVIGRYWINLSNEYYIIDNNTVTNNPVLKNIINKIQLENNLYIYDFSYNFNVPVLMAMIVNKNTHAITVNLGSSPVFDIALERILTELYQGVNNFTTQKIDGQYASRGYCDFRVKEFKWPGSQAYLPIIPEELILNAKKVLSPSKIFLTGKEYSNKYLYDYTINVINKINNFDIYYKDNSGCAEMYALQLFDINNINYLNNLEFLQESYDTAELITCAKEYYEITSNYIDNKIVDVNKLYNLSKKFLNMDYYESEFSCYLMYNNYFIWTITTPINVRNISELIITLHDNLHIFTNNENPFVFQFLRDRNIYQELNKFAIMIRYFNGHYKPNECLKIFNFLKLNQTNDDLNNASNFEYLINKIVFANLNNYHNGKYDNYIKMLASYKIN